MFLIQAVPHTLGGLRVLLSNFYFACLYFDCNLLTYLFIHLLNFLITADWWFEHHHLHKKHIGSKMFYSGHVHTKEKKAHLKYKRVYIQVETKSYFDTLWTEVVGYLKRKINQNAKGKHSIKVTLAFEVRLLPLEQWFFTQNITSAIT